MEGIGRGPDHEVAKRAMTLLKTEPVAADKLLKKLENKPAGAGHSWVVDTLNEVTGEEGRLKRRFREEASLELNKQEFKAHCKYPALVLSITYICKIISELFFITLH